MPSAYVDRRKNFDGQADGTLAAVRIAVTGTAGIPSAVLEKHEELQVLQEIYQTGITSDEAGLRRGHSTETAVLKVYNDAVIASDKGEVTCLLLLDYSAAFDTVDHNILLTILEESFGITGSVLAWIQSFLTDRHQIFQVGPDRSPMVVVLYGLPQGTILGPQMYILYTADLESILERHGVKMHLYADDTQLYHHSRTNNLEQAMVKFEACLEDMVQWSSQRRLKLNPTKTELIWLDRAHAIERLPQQPRLRMSSNDLTSSSSVRVLGVIIDSGLTLVTHVSIVARNCFYQQSDKLKKIWMKVLWRL